MAIIKFAWRSNLLYPIHSILWTFARKMDILLLDIIFHFSANIFFTLIMFFAEFFTGLLCYYIQNPYVNNQAYDKKTNDIYVYLPSEMGRKDSLIKIYFLIFVAAYFDFIEFILWTNYIPKFKHSSSSFDTRLGALMIISSALFYRYVFKFSYSKTSIFFSYDYGYMLNFNCYIGIHFSRCKFVFYLWAIYYKININCLGKINSFFYAFY